MSFLDGLQKAFSESKPLGQNGHNGQKTLSWDKKIGFGHIGHIGHIHPSTKIPSTITPDQGQETPSKVSVGETPTPGGNLPPWVRAYTPGEPLDDSKERVCTSPRCEAVFMRQAEQSGESWSNKRFCTGQCFSGQPSISLESEAVGVMQ